MLLAVAVACAPWRVEQPSIARLHPMLRSLTPLLLRAAACQVQGPTTTAATSTNTTITNGAVVNTTCKLLVYRVRVPLAEAVDFLVLYSQDAEYPKYYVNEVTGHTEKFVLDVNLKAAHEVRPQRPQLGMLVGVCLPWLGSFVLLLVLVLTGGGRGVVRFFPSARLAGCRCVHATLPHWIGSLRWFRASPPLRMHVRVPTLGTFVRTRAPTDAHVRAGDTVHSPTRACCHRPMNQCSANSRRTTTLSFWLSTSVATPAAWTLSRACVVTT